MIDHLTEFDCVRCGHTALAHYRIPGCQACQCSADPLCWCGALTSKHYINTKPDWQERLL